MSIQKDQGFGALSETSDGPVVQSVLWLILMLHILYLLRYGTQYEVICRTDLSRKHRTRTKASLLRSFGSGLEFEWMPKIQARSAPKGRTGINLANAASGMNVRILPL